MSRMSILTQRPKRTVGALAAALAAVGVAVGSGADFTATTANPNNSFAAGTLSMSNAPGDNTAILTASNMKPGAAATTGVADIGNTGTLAGDFTLSRSALTTTSSPSLAGKLNVVVKDCGDFSSGTPTCDAGDPDVYSDPLDGMTGTYSLGEFSPNEKHRYQFSVDLDSSADDTYQDKNATATFAWNAVQTP